ncbi:hypothetical protein NR800_37345 [Corallococcus interemptor]|uniref:hypothetical protein n=1 Tax=Corallococcus interemptor TaxID=2316720 RepID=UPI0035D46E2C
MNKEFSSLASDCDYLSLLDKVRIPPTFRSIKWSGDDAVYLFVQPIHLDHADRLFRFLFGPDDKRPLQKYAESMERMAADRFLTEDLFDVTPIPSSRTRSADASGVEKCSSYMSAQAGFGVSFPGATIRTIGELERREVRTLEMTSGTFQSPLAGILDGSWRRVALFSLWSAYAANPEMAVKGFRYLTSFNGFVLYHHRRREGEDSVSSEAEVSGGFSFVQANGSVKTSLKRASVFEMRRAVTYVIGDAYGARPELVELQAPLKLLPNASAVKGELELVPVNVVEPDELADPVHVYAMKLRVDGLPESECVNERWSVSVEDETPRTTASVVTGKSQVKIEFTDVAQYTRSPNLAKLPSCTFRVQIRPPDSWFPGGRLGRVERLVSLSMTHVKRVQVGESELSVVLKGVHRIAASDEPTMDVAHPSGEGQASLSGGMLTVTAQVVYRDSMNVIDWRAGGVQVSQVAMNCVPAVAGVSEGLRRATLTLGQNLSGTLVARVPVPGDFGSVSRYCEVVPSVKFSVIGRASILKDGQPILFSISAPVPVPVPVPVPASTSNPTQPPVNPLTREGG